MDRKNYQKIGLWLICLLVFAACKKEPGAGTGPVPESGDKVFVICEGSYGSGNASLWLYHSEQDTLYGDVFKTINKVPVGDVLQSMVRIGEQYMLCVNNSDRVLVLNKDLRLEQTISMSKPRYIMPVHASKAYVSALFTNKLTILDPAAGRVTGTIELPAQNPEGMALLDGKLYVCPWDTTRNQVYVIDTATDALVDSIAVMGPAPSEVLVDKHGRLWVLSGNAPKGKQAYWTIIDPKLKQIVKSFAFPPEADPLHPVMNQARDSVYFIEVNYDFGTTHNGIFRMSIEAGSLPAEAFIPAVQGQYFWALGLHPETGEVYIGDPRGFTQKSRIQIYTPGGSLKKEFEVGAGAGHFYFTD